MSQRSTVFAADSGADFGATPQRTTFDLPVLSDTESATLKIHAAIERAVVRCGSAAALARALDVKPPTVSQWRSRRKHPDAIHLVRIQELASSLPEPYRHGAPRRVALLAEKPQ